MAGMTSQSGMSVADAGCTGTRMPKPVCTPVRTPITLTSKGCPSPGRSSAASSLAVVKASRIADRPVSKQPSRARTEILMAEMTPKMSFTTIEPMSFPVYSRARDAPGATHRNPYESLPLPSARQPRVERAGRGAWPPASRRRPGLPLPARRGAVRGLGVRLGAGVAGAGAASAARRTGRRPGPGTAYA
ncbi:hypothetical protein D3C72_1480830 [compost metagenome]